MIKRDAATNIVYAIRNFQNADYSEDYKRDIKSVGLNLILILIESQLHTAPLEKIPTSIIEKFLKSYYQENRRSGTYENKRKTLNSIFQFLVTAKELSQNPMLNIERKKMPVKSKYLFSAEELQKVFGFLKIECPDFHLYALICHHVLVKRITTEARNISKGDFDDDFNEITLSVDGQSKKRGIPTELRKILVKKGLGKLRREENIFTGSADPYSRHYFNKQWSKIRKKMLDKGIISHLDYDIDVFFDCAVLEEFKKKKDISHIRQLLGFTTLFKTRYYLETLTELEVA